MALGLLKIEVILERIGFNGIAKIQQYLYIVNRL